MEKSDINPSSSHFRPLFCESTTEDWIRLLIYETNLYGLCSLNKSVNFVIQILINDKKYKCYQMLTNVNK